MKLKITVDGKVYEVEVEVAEPEAPQPAYLPPTGGTRVAATPTAVAAPLVPAAGPAPDENKICRSPFAGVVVRVSAQLGQAIHVNDVLMVLEAMKMETVITSPIAGKVARVNVNIGDAVAGGQVLVEFA